MNTALKDSYNRPIRDLRVSLTDRCNFRCFYCLPHGEPPIAPKEQMLSYEEIEYVCDIFVELGIEKIRLTGGEPMMRRDIETIIEKLSRAETKRTAGSGTDHQRIFPSRSRAGFERRRTRSHHDQCRQFEARSFKQMTGVDVLDRVLAGIAAAKERRAATDQDQRRHRARSQRR